ncbi:hypothetical protein PR202_gb10575 [Eleusine coracana subsp. coracana]|uniref:Uncharacterized protein n=1 Tax=Eleusine coracana subsp. coracana TaxID=191504 RepID=A0AAV5EKJ2_ELECO|nr:hypothetical protein PR202_gb10575 [Eleusine coracana subsp. coracana]
MARRRRWQQNQARVLVVVYDCKVGHLVFRFNLKRLFSNETATACPAREKEILAFPACPVARFGRYHCLEFAVSPDGMRIFAASNKGRTFICDTTTGSDEQCSSGPDNIFLKKNGQSSAIH